MLQYSMYNCIYLSFIRDLLKLNKVLYQMSAPLFYEDKSQWNDIMFSLKEHFIFLWWLLLPMQNFVK